MNNMIIEIENLRLKGFVGVYKHEQTNPQDICISVRLSFNAAQAVKTDTIEYAVDYEKISNDIRALLSNNKFRLIETLAQRIVDMISADGRITHAEVKVSKPGAIPAAQNVSAIVNFNR